MTPTSDGETIVAQVVLKPASGREITPSSAITVETLPEFLPDPSEAEAVARHFAAAGFEVGPLVGIGMSIFGPIGLFEDYFDAEVRPAEEGGWATADGVTRELPLQALPEPVATRVHAITFEPPAEAVALP